MKNYDIHERIFNFIVDVLVYINKLPKTSVNLVIINQVIRSSTSMGANDQEADGSLTKKDFIHCCTTVRKESKETVFWLRMAKRLNPSAPMNRDLILEGQEIVVIISKIITNASLSNKDKK